MAPKMKVAARVGPDTVTGNNEHVNYTTERS